MNYHISFHKTAARPSEPLEPLGTRAVTSIALPPDMDAKTASMVRHQINEALNALLDASILDCSIRAILD
jgi:hypothetical protein